MSSHNFKTNEKLKEDYMVEFKEQANMIDFIVDKPTYHMVCTVILGLEANFKAMYDHRDPKYG